ncbi:N-acetylneuraminate epimerase [bioreactor metagenome]|uniref:N-acetylneuraminate epimerase n=1 Tax=bioreactor metagenome TaxID=1076179 RepID=A0A644XDP4_9ZZZZ
MRKIMVKILGIAVLLITIFLPNTCAFANEEKTSWKQLAPMPTSSWILQTEVVDGKIYTIAGLGDSDYSTPISPTEVYDSSTDTWATLASMPTPRWGFETEVIDGKIYGIGGWGIGGTPVTSTEVYDPSTDTWTVLAPMSVAQGDDFQTEVIDGKIYAIGSDGTCTSSTGVYDPSTDTWTILSAMPTARTAFQTEVINGKIYVLGGYSGSAHNSDMKPLSSTEVYDPSTDTWTTLPPLITPRCFFQTEVIDGKIYALGGWNVNVWDSEGKTLSSIEVYDPSTNTWTTLAPMSTTRCWLQTEVIDGEIYAIGGEGIIDGIDYTPISSTEVYDPSTDTWTTLASMSKSKCFLFNSEVIDKVIYAIDECSFESYAVNTSSPNNRVIFRYN